jgi:hypothetical protein
MAISEALIYDPSTFANYELQLTQEWRFSSVREGMWTLHGRRIDWSATSDVLNAMAPTADGSFVLYRPWHPGAKRRRSRFEQHFAGDARLIGHDSLVVSVGPPNFAELFQLRTILGGGNSGPWLIGTMSDAQKLEEAIRASLNIPVDSLLFLSAAVASEVNLCLALEEGEESLLLIRAKATETARLDGLCDRLTSLGVRVRSEHKSRDRP